MIVSYADDAGASTSKAPPGGNEGDTAEACFLQTQAPEEGQLEVSKVLQGRSTSGSDMNPNTGSLDEGGRASPVEAMMGGLSVRASSPILPASLSPVHGQQPLSGEALKRLSETLPQQVQMSASPDAFGLGDASWHHVGLQLAGTFCRALTACALQARAKFPLQGMPAMHCTDINSWETWALSGN